MSVFNLRKEDFILLCSNQYHGDKKETLKANLTNICRFSGGEKTLRNRFRNRFCKKTLRKSALRKTRKRKYFKSTN